MPGVITADKLAELLRCSRGGLLRGKSRDALPVTYLNEQRVFTFEEVDRFILDCARNGAVPPSTDELVRSLRSGENLLITPKEAGEILGRKENTLSSAREERAQPYLQIGAMIRYVKSEIVAEAEKRDLDSRALVKILCVSLPTLQNLVDTGFIRVHRKGPKGIRYEADKAHLREQLRKWLPPYVDPDEWIATQIKATEPAITINRVGRDSYTTKRRIEEFELPYLRIGKMHWSLPAETVRAILADNMPAMEVGEIAELFGVAHEQADTWIQEKALVCHMHVSKPARCLLPACLRRYIHSHGTVENRWQWYGRRLNEKERLYSDTELVATFGGQHVISGIKKRRLQGVRLPGETGGWRFLHQDVMKFATTHTF